MVLTVPRKALHESVGRKAHMGRRLLPAVLIAVLTTSILVGVVGANNAASGDGSMPASVAVPATRMGDRGSYTRTIEGNNVYPDYPTGPNPWLDFSWSPGTRLADHAGATVDTDRVDESHYMLAVRSSNGKLESIGFKPFNYTEYFEKGTPRPIAFTGAWGYQDEAFSNPLDGIPLVPQLINQTDRSRFDSGFLFFAPQGARDCLMASDFMGATLSTSEPVELRRGPGGCGCPSAAGDTCNDEFQAGGVEEIRGIQAVRFDRIVNATQASESVWVAPGIPYLLRIQDTSPPAASFMRITYDLTPFEPGSKPRSFGLPATHAPSLAVAPRTAWGPDDAAVAHPFKLSQAFQLAKTDSKFRELRDYLGAHPKAYMAQASYFESQLDDRSVRTWSFAESDGTDDFYMEVNQTEQKVPILDLRVPAQLRDAATSYEFWHYDPGTYLQDLGLPPAHFPPLSALETSLPTVASLQARWPTFAPGTTAANAWGFSSLCYDPCDAPATFLVVGNNAITLEVMRLDPGTGHYPFTSLTLDLRIHELAMDAQGDAVLMLDIGFHDDYHTQVGPHSAAAPSRAVVTSMAKAETLQHGWLPNAAQAAGISLLGLLAGAIYWAWPAAKAGAIGLFSRVRTPQLLDNPQRARLMTMVEADPGVHFQELGRRSGLPNGTLVHHLRKLTHGGLVVARASGGYTCYFPHGAGRLQIAAAPAMKSDGARAILAAVVAQPGLTSQEVALRCNLQASTVTYHVKRLMDGGLVTASRDGRFVRLHPGPTAHTLAPAAAAVAAS